MSQTFYAISGSGGTPSTLYTINKATAAILTTVGSTGLSHFTSIAFKSDSTLYAVNNNTDSLYTISTVDGTPTLIGATGLGINIPGLSFSAGAGWGTDTLYGVTGNRKVVSFDLGTGAGTVLNSSIPTGGSYGICFNASGQLFIKNFSKLYSVSTGFVYTQVCSFSTGQENAFAISETNGYYSIKRPSTQSNLYTINTTTGTATLIGDIGTGDNDIGGFTFTPASPPPAPPVFSTANPIVPQVGIKGTVVQLRGSDLSNVSTVTFNGTSATFVIVNSTLITAIVPSAATSGNVVLTDAAAQSTTTRFTVLGNVPASQIGTIRYIVVPAQIIDLTATAYPTDPSKITLNWSVLPDAVTYNIYRSTSSGTETLYATGVTGTTYDDTGLSNVPEYFYKVKGVNVLGTGPFSNEASAVPIFPPVFGGAASDIGNDIALTWTAPNAGATSYNIYRGTTSGGEVLYDNTASTTYTDSATSDNVCYYYEITALGAYGETAPSDELSSTNGVISFTDIGSFTGGTGTTSFSATVPANGVLIVSASYDSTGGTFPTYTWNGHVMANLGLGGGCAAAAANMAVDIRYYKNIGATATANVDIDMSPTTATGVLVSAIVIEGSECTGVHGSGQISANTTVDTGFTANLIANPSFVYSCFAWYVPVDTGAATWSALKWAGPSGPAPSSTPNTGIHDVVLSLSGQTFRLSTAYLLNTLPDSVVSPPSVNHWRYSASKNITGFGGPGFCDPIAAIQEFH